MNGIFKAVIGAIGGFATLLFSYLPVKNDVKDGFDSIDFTTPETRLQLSLLALLSLLGWWLVIYLKRSKRRTDWFSHFAFAGPAKKFDLAKVSIQSRRFDIPFIQTRRGLNKPWTMALERNPENQQISEDASAYFIQKRTQHAKTQAAHHQGILLEGNPFIGKSRLVAQVLQTAFPDHWLLVPQANSAIPELGPDAIHHFKNQRLDIVLDDLELFQDRLPEITRLLTKLKANGCAAFIWATLRNGGPAAIVQGNEAFRPLCELLERHILNAPTDAMLQEMATAANETPMEHPLEHNFSFVEHQAFAEMRLRWRTLSEPAKGIMRSAATLDTRGIALTQDRWRDFARAIDHIDLRHQWPTACQELTDHGFLFAMSPDPGVLQNVVDTLGDDQTVLAYCFQQQDLQLLYEWCRKKYDNKDYAFVKRELGKLNNFDESVDSLAMATGYKLLGLAHYYDDTKEHTESCMKQAINYGERANSAAGWVEAAKASYNLGVLHAEQQRPDTAADAYRKAIDYGERANSAAGWVEAAGAAYALGFLNSEQQRPDLAADAYRKAIEYAGRADSAAGWVEAARAANNLGFLHVEQQRPDTAADAYRKAIDYGERADSAAGWVEAAGAAYALGFLNSEQQRPDSAADAYRKAIDYGERSDSAAGWVQAASAARNLGLLHKQQQRPDLAADAYRQAIDYGERADSAEGWVQAARAVVNLGVLYVEQQRPDPAADAYRQAIDYGERADSDAGWVQAAKAAYNLGLLHAEQQRPGLVADAYRKVIVFWERVDPTTGRDIGDLAARLLRELDKDRPGD
ncbi:tetratricopeptide repeat protein [Methylomonas koyamae]|uniref:tetratricopeptide repeat protein n=1 Tax=Methylomonas koyamae TaxID=702114 RepID=UPI00112C21F4|nr:tetratricopeptide repeat protein [Methylomonas koyamae]TPQ24389.1 hypothetical protein C2U68_19870 [Methylomonas koyamae]